MKKIVLTSALLVAAICGLQAQNQAMPTDKDVRIGQLDNGLTYYIRHNELPKERCEFHIAQAVGATLEEDDQNGLAHFLEHMCFNGTEHFPGKGIIEYFESVGVNFGGNINAYTSLDKTVYRLSEVPTYREGIIDSALLVMHDWSCAVSLLPEEIDNERGVIREEWRTGNTASRRIWKRSNQLMYPGSKYAIRDVIGDTAVINNFSYDAIRAYYKKWYGPDLQAIVVVGDIDVDQIEAKIKALWADVPARENRGERPYEMIADNKKPIIATVQDVEAQSSRITVIYKLDSELSVENRKLIKGSQTGYVLDLFNNLIQAMLSERLQEITLQPTAPIMGGYMAYGDIFPTLSGFYSTVVPKEGREKESLLLLLEQIEKMRRYGFTDDELERAKTDMLNGYEKSYNERTATRNISYVNEYIRNFLEGEAIPGIELEYQLVQQVLPHVTVDVLNNLAATYVSDENIVVNITGPKNDKVKMPSNKEVLKALKKMKKLKIQAPEKTEVDTELVKEMPTAGNVVSTSQNESLGTTEWVLSNGVRVVIKPTEFKKDEILMSAYSFGGLTLVSTEDLPTAELATDLIDMMGLGEFSITQLQKALTGKTVSCSASINANTEGVSGSSSVKDFETLLQLVYLGFTAPRRDEDAYKTLMNLLENQLKNKDTNPKAAFSDSISLMNTAHSERTTLWNLETLKKVSLDRAMAIYSERFANPADFTFFFVGNINPNDEETKKLICTYLGGLATNDSRESFKDLGIRAPQGVVKNYFRREMQTKTGSNRIQYTSYDIPYTLDNAVNMQILGSILSTRYLESIREREGGSYGVGTSGYMQAFPVAKAVVIMQFDTDPEKQAKLMSIIHEEVMTIAENGPLATDLQKEKESMLKDYKENLEKNGWWLNTIDCYFKLGINYATEYEAAVNRITSESVQNMVKQLLASGNMFEVVMLPQE